MKYLLCLCFLCLAFLSTSIAQEATKTVAKKECQPSKECAEKMGMTLEQCKAICDAKKASTSTASASTNQTATVTPALFVTNSKSAEKSSCCKSTKTASLTSADKKKCSKSSATKTASKTNSKTPEYLVATTSTKNSK